MAPADTVEANMVASERKYRLETCGRVRFCIYGIDMRCVCIATEGPAAEIETIKSKFMRDILFERVLVSNGAWWGYDLCFSLYDFSYI